MIWFALIPTYHLFVKLHLISLYKYAKLYIACEQLVLFILFITCFCILLYHITFNIHRSWNNLKELISALSTIEKRGTMFTKTDSTKKTTILITTQQTTEQTNGIGIWNMKNNLYLICITGRIFVWFLKTINLRNKTINGTCYHYIAPQ